MSSAPGESVAPAVPAPVVSRRVRGLVIAASVLLLAHFAATFLWAAPGHLTGRPDRDGVAAEAPATGTHRALETYMTPVFAQDWSLFAPSPLHVDYELRVRGVYTGGPDGGLRAGPWIDTTAVEAGGFTGHVLPAVTERPSRRLASSVRAAYLALPEDAWAVVLRSPATARGAVPAPDPWPGLRRALLDAGAAPGVVDDYLAEDRALAAYATQVLGTVRPGERGRARADAPGRRPVYVQASIVRRAVTPYGTTLRPEPTELTLGARPPVGMPGPIR